VFIGLVLLTLFRLLMLAWLPLELSGDEAYYWEWGRHLDWGYYSKPPGIGWLMGFAGWLGGDTTFGLRCLALGLASGGLVFFHLLGCQLFDARTAALATLLLALSPAHAALAMMLTIDAPLMFCWLAAMLSFWRFIRSECRSVGWGLALGVALAGGLLSKQMMAVFAPLAIAFLGSNPTHRSCLRRPGLWIALGLPFVAWLPPLWWNVQNDWVTLSHTLHHFDAASSGWVRRLQRMLEFVAGSVALPSPVVGVMLLVVVGIAPVLWKRWGSRERFLWLFSGPGFWVLALLSFRQRINANWPAVFLPGALLLVAAWMTGRWDSGGWFDGGRRAARTAVAVAAISFALVYASATAFSLEWISSPRWDPTRRIRGWSELARDITPLRQRLPDPDGSFLVTQTHRFVTSQLAFHLPDHPRVYPFHEAPGRIVSQYDLWPSPAEHYGRDALIIVTGARDQLSQTLAARFEAVEFLGELDYRARTERNRHYSVFHGRRLKAWPQ
jgi:hypothetical protein